METDEQREERMFVLRPYVFAPQQYELCFAPWTIANLPILDPVPPITRDNPFIADLTPKARKTTVYHFGRPIDISGPLLAHAAILLFFVKRPGAKKTEDSGLLLPIQALLAQNNTQGQGQATQALPGTNGIANGDGTQPQPSQPALPVARVIDEDEEDGDETFGAIRDLVSNSANHDRDFARLRSCFDPFSCKGMKRSAWRGSWEGSWEGNFSFFDFEAFKEMLAGKSSALYEGDFGEQAQVWRLSETWVWRKEWGVKKVRQREKEREERAKARLKRKEKGEEVTDDEEEQGGGVVDKGKGKARGLPLTGPATNAGFPTDVPPSTSAGLATAAAEAITLKETIQQQVDALEGFEIVPKTELEEALNESDGGEAAGLEMILTGVGHSAWGRFILKGKVRAWDGMASLVKEYAVSGTRKAVHQVY